MSDSIGREAYIRLLVDGYRAIKQPVPEWLQRELDGLPPLPTAPSPDWFNQQLEALVVAVGDNCEVTLGTAELLHDTTTGAPYTKGSFTAHAVPVTTTVRWVELRDKDGNVLMQMPLSNTPNVTAGDDLTVTIDAHIDLP